LFFFEKKNQKTFASLAAHRWPQGAPAVGRSGIGVHHVDFQDILALDVLNLFFDLYQIKTLAVLIMGCYFFTRN